MSTKTATLTLANDDMRLEAVTGSGHTVVLDNGISNTGPRPAELVGIALAGCTGMDVISILRKKRQPVTRYEIQVSGEQLEDHPNTFTRFDVVHVVEGEGIDPAAVARSIELSCTKYCSVGSTLASGAVELHHAYRILSGGTVLEAEVLVTGPGGAVTLAGTAPVAAG